MSSTRARNHIVAVVAGLATACLAGCSMQAASPRAPGPAATAGAARGDAVLREVLPPLAKGHSDKIQLAAFASVPILHKLDPAVRAFATRMSAQQRDLLQEAKAVAQARGIPLKFAYAEDAFGQAQKRMEKEQGDALQASGSSFSLLMLTLMYTDYAWQKHLARAALADPAVSDPAVRAYLEKSARIHDEGGQEITALLKRHQLR